MSWRADRESTSSANSDTTSTAAFSFASDAGAATASASSKISAVATMKGWSLYLSTSLIVHLATPRTVTPTPTSNRSQASTRARVAHLSNAESPAKNPNTTSSSHSLVQYSKRLRNLASYKWRYRLCPGMRTSSAPKGMSGRRFDVAAARALAACMVARSARARRGGIVLALSQRWRCAVLLWRSLRGLSCTTCSATTNSGAFARS
mmetsp:Transcript_23282/g.60671  ORF Transcript_23282/g.60671 Transcript_23282/m.60671 type:complete len:206 (-) Transcript_23282:91-708(-)